MGALAGVGYRRSLHLLGSIPSGLVWIDTPASSWMTVRAASDLHAIVSGEWILEESLEIDLCSCARHDALVSLCRGGLRIIVVVFSKRSTVDRNLHFQAWVCIEHCHYVARLGEGMSEVAGRECGPRTAREVQLEVAKAVAAPVAVSAAGKARRRMALGCLDVTRALRRRPAGNYDPRRERRLHRSCVL